MAWCFLGKIGDPKGQNLRYILILRVEGLPLWLSLWGGGRAHWWQVVGSLWLVLSFRGVFSSSGRVFPAFWSLCCSSLGASLANMALFCILRAFLAWFGVVVWVCVVLVVCVACVAFVRVWS